MRKGFKWRLLLIMVDMILAASLYVGANGGDTAYLHQTTISYES